MSMQEIPQGSINSDNAASPNVLAAPSNPLQEPPAGVQQNEGIHFN